MIGPVLKSVMKTPYPLSKSSQLFFCPKSGAMFWNVCKNNFSFFFVQQNFYFKFLGHTYFSDMLKNAYIQLVNVEYSETLTSDARYPVGLGIQSKIMQGPGAPPRHGMWGPNLCNTIFLFILKQKIIPALILLMTYYLSYHERG